MTVTMIITMITMTMLRGRTDPRDVARSEGRTFLCTAERLDSVPTPEGVKGQLGNWMHPDQLQASDSTNSNNNISNNSTTYNRLRWTGCTPAA